ncbi:hypothetical protein D9M73_134880 [compost metagenome]
MAEHFLQDLRARAIDHALLDVIADAIVEQAVPPPHRHALGLIGKERLVIDGERDQPARLLEGDQPAGTGGAAAEAFHQLQEQRVLDRDGVGNPRTFGDVAVERGGVAEGGAALRELLPQFPRARMVAGVEAGGLGHRSECLVGGHRSVGDEHAVAGRDRNRLGAVIGERGDAGNGDRLAARKAQILDPHAEAELHAAFLQPVDDRHGEAVILVEQAAIDALLRVDR